MTRSQCGRRCAGLTLPASTALLVFGRFDGRVLRGGVIPIETPTRLLADRGGNAVTLLRGRGVPLAGEALGNGLG